MISGREGEDTEELATGVYGVSRQMVVDVEGPEWGQAASRTTTFPQHLFTSFII